MFQIVVNELMGLPRSELWLETKELSLWHKLRFSDTYIFATQCRRPLKSQTVNLVTSNILSLKYQVAKI